MGISYGYWEFPTPRVFRFHIVWRTGRGSQRCSHQSKPGIHEQVHRHTPQHSHSHSTWHKRTMPVNHMWINKSSLLMSLLYLIILIKTMGVWYTMIYCSDPFSTSSERGKLANPTSKEPPAPSNNSSHFRVVCCARTPEMICNKWQYIQPFAARNWLPMLRKDERRCNWHSTSRRCIRSGIRQWGRARSSHPPKDRNQDCIPNLRCWAGAFF